jgi:hypothetical protein
VCRAQLSVYDASAGACHKRMGSPSPFNAQRMLPPDSGKTLGSERVFRPGSLSSSQQAFIDGRDATVRLPRKEDRPGRAPVGKHPLATNRWARYQVARVMREYLVHACGA